MNFRGRWLLVTGASSGLGREMARQLAQKHGAHLILVARRKPRLDELKTELETHGVQVLTIEADLSKLEEVERVVEQATSGRELYGAILNAGITHFGPHEQLEWSEFQRMLDTNVTGVTRMTGLLIPKLEALAQGGGLMIVASMAGITPVPYQTAYSATKAFLVHLGCGLWHELQGRPLSITTFAPGGVVTEMTAGESFVPLRSWLMPVDAAASEGLECFRQRKYLYVSGAANRIGSAFTKLLPQQTLTGWVAASYRRALERSGKL
jgi:short-subunit dehydrogenase